MAAKQEKKTIGALSVAVPKVIRSMQPFAQPKGDLADPLLLLHDLARVDRHRLLHLTAAQPTELELKPPIVVAPYIEATVTVRVFFVEPGFMQVDVLDTLINSINAVGLALVQIRECEGQ
jgi:hypothetical protein